MDDADLLCHFDNLLIHWRERGLDIAGASIEQLLRACVAIVEGGAPSATVRNDRARVIAFAMRVSSDAEYRFVKALVSYAMSLPKRASVLP